MRDTGLTHLVFGVEVGGAIKLTPIVEGKEVMVLGEDVHQSDFLALLHCTCRRVSLRLNVQLANIRFLKKPNQKCESRCQSCPQCCNKTH